MTRHERLDIFGALFPELAEKTVSHGEEGGESLRIVLNDRRILIFTYQDAKRWSLETLKTYATRMAKKGD